MYVIITMYSYTFGTFPTEIEAIEWAKVHCGNQGWFVRPITSPADA
jgi:hypothetical protein